VEVVDMQVSVAIHEIISWIVAAISIALFIHERRKNNLTPFYMNLQGILKACHAKAIFYFQVANQIEQCEDSADKKDIIMWRGVSSDFESLKQTVMGVMKAVEPNKDAPFNDRDYTTIREPNPIETPGK
jgi:hypothetical protein